MKEWENILIDPQITILKAIEIIDKNAIQIALVVDDSKKLLGTVTDGDVRRAILKGTSLDKPVSFIMNVKPVTMEVSYNREQVLKKMKNTKIRQIPIVDSQNYVIGMETVDDLLQGVQYDNWVVIMAGGLGSRLGDLTQNCPKPLIAVGGKPLLETIVENFKQDGFCNIFLSVNYKAEMIEQYFGDGSTWNLNIKYLREPKKLGTAGALSLLQEIPDKPIIVMNGDLLTKVNFQQLLEYHMQNKALATMCVRDYSVQIPYGVVRIENNRLCGIDEKPVNNYFVSAGIYVIDPKAFDFIPPNTYFDMPSLFNAIIESGIHVNVFPIREYWIDIGKRDDLEKANSEYGGVFG